MIYWLQGPPGAGKSTVGEMLARLIGLPFVDTDVAVEQQHGAIGTIFARSGEEEFRRLERIVIERIVAESSDRSTRVVALGGGALLDPVSRDLVRSSGVRILLDVSPEMALARLHDAVDRPLLAGDPADRWHRLVEVRRKLYEDADITVDADGAPADVAEAIFARISVLREPAWSLAAELDRERSTVMQFRTLHGLAAWLRDETRGRRVCIVTDTNVSGLYPATLLALADEMILHVIEPGETSKGLSDVERLAARLAEAGFTRRDVIVGFGGGVVTDLAGFVASIYMRGIRSIAVPTTLLAQVDASVGGKTAVNAAGVRNLLGTFRQPSNVLLSSAVLWTLPKRVLRSGFVESMKMGIANSTELDAEVRRAAPLISLGMMPENVDRLVESSVGTKLAVVAGDVRDHGARMSLNLGHTFGHALEGCMPDVFAHGEAVAFGIIAAAELATLLGLLGARRRDEIVERLLPFTRPEALELDRQALLDAMRADKKRSTEAFRFILPRDEGGVEAVEADAAAARDAVERALGRIATFHLSP